MRPRRTQPFMHNNGRATVKNPLAVSPYHKLDSGVNPAHENTGVPPIPRLCAHLSSSSAFLSLKACRGSAMVPFTACIGKQTLHLDARIRHLICTDRYPDGRVYVGQDTFPIAGVFGHSTKLVQAPTKFTKWGTFLA